MEVFYTEILCTVMQYNICGNIGEELNFVTREQGLNSYASIHEQQ